MPNTSRINSADVAYFKPLCAQPPCIGHMLYSNLFPPFLPDTHQVEPVLVARPSVTSAPARRDSSHGGLLARAHRLARCTTFAALSSLDLDESNQAIAPHHQVDIVSAQAESMGFDFPSARDQVRECVELAAHAAQVAAVGPPGNRDEGWARHGASISEHPARACIERAQTSTES